MEQKKKLLLTLIKEFYPYAKKRLGFSESCKVSFSNDKENAKDPLGKTAYYDPNEKKITVYVTERHTKDILRSFSHELVHHAQNCRGEFNQNTVTEEGYAQKDEHLRNMEKEAYLEGNMIFRDWTDLRKWDVSVDESIYIKRKNIMKSKKSPIIKKKDWKEKLFEGRNKMLMDWLFYQDGLTLNEEESAESDMVPVETLGHLANEIMDYHGGQGTALYALGSSLMAGNPVSVELIDSALTDLEMFEDEGAQELALQLRDALAMNGYNLDLSDDELEENLPDLTSKSPQQRLEKNKEKKAKKEKGKERYGKLSVQQKERIKEIISSMLAENKNKKFNKDKFVKILSETLKKKDLS